MICLDPDPTLIFASDGSTIHRLHLHFLKDGSPVLKDDAGDRITPWEVALVRWSSTNEAVLKRSGYLPARRFDPEL